MSGFLWKLPGDVALTCLDVDIGCLDCIQVAVVDCLTDGDVGLSLSRCRHRMC